jgi:tryptophan synthase alpha chain
MDRINKAFQTGKAFVAFVTGGDPSIQKTKEFILAMQEAGADLIEIGVPFSDPIAEGPIIQEANIRALASGTTLDGLLDMVAELRSTDLQVPLCFMTYLNPIFRYGYEPFFKRAADVGLDGIITPDMPFEEQAELRPAAKAHGIKVISLVAPTSEARAGAIARESEGFLYLVSSMGVTGVRSEITTDLAPITAAIRAETDTPIAIGFGIHTPEQAAAMATHGDGVIVGSRIVSIIAEHGEASTPHIAAYVHSMKEALAKSMLGARMPNN